MFPGLFCSHTNAVFTGFVPCHKANGEILLESAMGYGRSVARALHGLHLLPHQDWCAPPHQEEIVDASFPEGVEKGRRNSCITITTICVFLIVRDTGTYTCVISADDREIARRFIICGMVKKGKESFLCVLGSVRDLKLGERNFLQQYQQSRSTMSNQLVLSCVSASQTTDSDSFVTRSDLLQHTIQ